MGCCLRNLIALLILYIHVHVLELRLFIVDSGVTQNFGVLKCMNILFYVLFCFCYVLLANLG